MKVKNSMFSMLEKLQLNKRFFLLLVAALLAVTAASLGLKETRSWLLPEETAQSSVAISDFKVSGKAAFKGVSAANLEGISISNPSSNQYLGDLEYEITYEGLSPAYVRVRIIEQWVDRKNNTIRDAAFMKYNNVDNDLWFDNRENDYCFYYKVPLQPGITVTENVSNAAVITSDKLTVPLFKGIDMSNVAFTDTNTDYKLIIQVEAVQPNRYREFWDITQLPWETAS